MNRTVSILGCGWLGLPLATALLQSGSHVRGSTTTPTKIPDLKQLGIEPFVINLTKNHQELDLRFFSSEVLFINIPFRRDFKNPFEYCEQLDQVLTVLKASAVRVVVFASSTSIYPSQGPEALEDVLFEPDNERSRALLKAENLFRNQKEFKTVILRLSGLCGYDRQIGKFLSGKVALADGQAPVNLVHRDDCVAIIVKSINEDIEGGVFNICCDGHPAKKDLYIRASKALGLTPPVFTDERVSQKIVSNQKIKSALKYSFKYPHPFDFK